MSALLEMRGIRKSFGDIEVLHGVDLSLKEGEIRAVVGHNGAGKSTLMKILAGVHAASSGTVLVRGVEVNFTGPAAAQARGIRMVFQEFSLVPSMTVLANMVLSNEPTRMGLLSGRRAEQITRRAFDRLGLDIDPDQEVAALPVGDRQLVEIAKAIAYDPAVLVLDEPTASLSSTEVQRLFEVVRRLAASGIGVVYISHHLDEIGRLCDTLTVLRDGAVVADRPVGGITVPEIVSLMLGATASVTALKGRNDAQSSRPLLSVQHLRVDPRVADLSFDVRAGEIVGLAGLLGSGRTEAMEAVFGLRDRQSGDVSLSGRRVEASGPPSAIRSGLMLVPDDRRTMGVLAGQSVQDNLLLCIWRRLTRFGFISRSRSRVRARVLADSMGIRAAGGGLGASIETLSGGNQQKVVIGRALAAQPRVLMLNEPSAGIDVGARRDIMAIVRDYVSDGRAALIASSDLQELASVCDRILFVGRGRVVASVDNDPAAPLGEPELLEILHRSTA